MGLALALVTVVAPTATAAVKAPTIANAAETHAKAGTTVTVAGTAGAGAVVALHYHRSGTAPNDYGIVRTVRANAGGYWSRPFTLDVDYRVFATVGSGNPHSATVLFTTQPGPTDVGGTQGARGCSTCTVSATITLNAVDGGARGADAQPAPGNRFVAVKLSVRNPSDTYSYGHDYYASDFAVVTSDGRFFAFTYTRVTDGPTINLSSVKYQETRVGYLVFEVPSSVSAVGLRYLNSSPTLNWKF